MRIIFNQLADEILYEYKNAKKTILKVTVSARP